MALDRQHAGQQEGEALLRRALPTVILAGWAAQSARLAWRYDSAERYWRSCRSTSETAKINLAAALQEREWAVRGVVRSVIPEINVLVVTHEDIPGFMPSMTMGFRAANPKLYAGLQVGDLIRFTLKGVPPNVTIVAITREGKS